MILEQLMSAASHMNPATPIKLIIQNLEQFSVDALKYDPQTKTLYLISNQPAEPFNET